MDERVRQDLEAQASARRRGDELEQSLGDSSRVCADLVDDRGRRISELEVWSQTQQADVARLANALEEQVAAEHCWQTDWPSCCENDACEFGGAMSADGGVDASGSSALACAPATADLVVGHVADSASRQAVEPSSLSSRDLTQPPLPPSSVSAREHLPPSTVATDLASRIAEGDRDIHKTDSSDTASSLDNDDDKELAEDAVEAVAGRLIAAAIPSNAEDASRLDALAGVELYRQRVAAAVSEGTVALQKRARNRASSFEACSPMEFRIPLKSRPTTRTR